MTGTQIKDLWQQWTVQAKSTWMKVMHGSLVSAAGAQHVPDNRPKLQDTSYDVARPSTREDSGAAP